MPGKSKSKSRRDWESDDSKLTSGLDQRTADLLEKYMADLYAWCRDLRSDLIRLEGHAGFGQGDPGDPPAGPWGPPK